jgi:glucan 1,3-beta-glucosidase
MVYRGRVPNTLTLTKPANSTSKQSNFYRQVRNLIIDIRDSTVEKAAGLHWQVAQATSLTNVFIYASLDSDTTQMGMFTENGSGGFMSNVYINGGKYGICE